MLVIQGKYWESIQIEVGTLWELFGKDENFSTSPSFQCLRKMSLVLLRFLQSEVHPKEAIWAARFHFPYLSLTTKKYWTYQFPKHVLHS